MVWRYLSCGLILPLLVMGVSLAEEGAMSSRSDTMHVSRKRHSLKELRDQHVVKQQLDYSCGAAALATLMIYYFGDETSEREILELLTARLTQDEQALKERQGFSLLDLKHVAQTKGYQAAGFILTIEQLEHLAAPVIVFVQPLGYKHFSVLRGMDRGRVFLADPARGNLRMGIGRFLREWSGIVFVLGKAGEENITTYPLALPQPAYVQPELLRVGRLSDFGDFPIHLAVRSRLR
jgi:predicted double-glycine peptidase